jgi:hypothetical protein
MSTKSKPVRAKPKANYAFQTQPKPTKSSPVFEFSADDLKKYFTTKKGSLVANGRFVKEVLRPQNETKCRFKKTGSKRHTGVNKIGKRSYTGEIYFNPSPYSLGY